MSYLYGLSVAAFFIVQIVSYHLLPHTIASHFTIHMTPNGYLPKPQYFTAVVSTFMLVNVLSVAVAVLLPRIPASMINTPKKQFWMRSENRPVFIAIMKNRFYGFLFLMNSVFTSISYYVLKANRSDPVVLSGAIHIWVIIALAGMSLGAIQLIVRLNRVDQDRN